LTAQPPYHCGYDEALWQFPGRSRNGNPFIDGASPAVGSIRLI